MLALALVLALGQCTKDTDCKGERVCTAGECVDPSPVVPNEALAFAAADRQARIDRLTQDLAELRAEYESANPYASFALILGGWALGALAGGLGYLYAKSGDGVYGGVGVVSFCGAVALTIGGWVQFGMRLHARGRLPVEIADREAGLRRLGVQLP